jgi:hypothetical protein
LQIIAHNQFGTAYRSGEVTLPLSLTSVPFGSQLLINSVGDIVDSSNSPTYPTERWVKVGKVEPATGTITTKVLFIELEDR